MNALLRTGAVLVGLLAGITALSAAPVLTLDGFDTDEFWNEMSQGE